MQHAIKQVTSENPPLVLEFDGVGHYGAWVRNVPMHKGPRVVEGLTRAFAGLVEQGGKRKAQQTKDTGHGAAAKKPQHSTKDKEGVPQPQRRHKQKHVRK